LEEKVEKREKKSELARICTKEHGMMQTNHFETFSLLSLWLILVGLEPLSQEKAVFDCVDARVEGKLIQ